MSIREHCPKISLIFVYYTCLYHFFNLKLAEINDFLNFIILTSDIATDITTLFVRALQSFL